MNILYKLRCWKNRLKWEYYNRKYGQYNFCSPELRTVIDRDRRKAIEILWWKVYGVKFPWKNPQTLNEKITWLSGASDTSLWTKYTDKFEVRKHVEELGLGHILTKCYGVWDRVEDIDFDSLPNSFVLKCTHDCGSTVIIRDKKKDLDIPKVSKFLNEHLTRIYGYDYVEPHYTIIKPRVMAEELLPYNEILPPPDYKFLCINGKVENCMVCKERKVGISEEEEECEKDIYSVTKWEPMKYICTKEWIENNFHKEVPEPKNLSEMVHYAEILSKGFRVLRVDLYNINGKIYFGELTFTPRGGILIYLNKDWQLKYGSKIKI